ncbi:MAG: hypothetical protein JWO93_1287 [Micrococcaceae bacterium]|jgi:hypothetical protein|nr:hypothetical protein [Micrococcaceae bacterium]
MSWTDEQPSWLPPIPPRRGKGLIVTGICIWILGFALVLLVGFLNQPLNLYTVLVMAVGLILLLAGLLRRSSS